MESFSAAHWLIVAGIVYVLWRILRRRPPPAGLAGTAPTPASKAAPPPARWIARWKIIYRDADGVATERIVRITAVRPRLERLEVWCEMRLDARTLTFDGLVAAEDAVTCTPIDFEQWLKETRRTVRKPAAE